MFENIFSGGRIEIVLDKASYALGETVNADVVLRLDKARSARGLNARICAYELVSQTYREHGAMGHSHTQSRTERRELFANEARLDGEKEYPAGESRYKVSFAIPNDKGLLSQPGFLGFIGGRRITWEISAKLDIAMAIDVNGRAALNVHE